MNTKLESEGPLLITHWGLSGPGILKVSSWGAKELSVLKYNYNDTVVGLVIGIFLCCQLFIENITKSSDRNCSNKNS